eukprot:TRINITY_DN61640_c0_g1_i1.p1 TRINITY_DN61640_c0_g1~~TRINITY_DN61640_c0_g1_i1.p1  ORF type:complete len:716 (-),score=164.02 TRINITY_DN61640_c0_g1_i1:137-2284(-)
MDAAKENSSSSGESNGEPLVRRSNTENYGFDVTYEEEVVNTAHEPRAVFGEGGVFDVSAERADDLPFEVPATVYLKEVLIGVRGAPRPTGDGSAEVLPSEGDSRGKDGNSRRWKKLNNLLSQSESGATACTALFWIAFAFIFKRGSPAVVAEMRHQLAWAWHTLDLAIQDQTEREPKTRDWLQSSVPSIMVQAVYRLFVDGFAEDKALLCQLAQPLLEMLSQISSHEFVGFQLNSETNKRLRRRLFTKSVMEFPYLNQRENAKSIMRLEALENASVGPLQFGNVDGTPTEELQLEHVMLAREALRKGPGCGRALPPLTAKTEDERENLTGIAALIAASIMGSSDFDMFNKRVHKWRLNARATADDLLEELCVDRHSDLDHEGLQLLRIQLEKIKPEAAADLVAESVDEGTEAAAEEEGVEDSDAAAGGIEETTFHVGGESFQSRRTGGSTHHRGTARKRKDQEREKRRRTELLKQLVLQNQLPKEFKDREMSTVWTSPIIDRLAPAGRSRQQLRKPAAEAHSVAMTPMVRFGTLPTLRGSASEPELSINSSLEARRTANDVSNSSIKAGKASNQVSLLAPDPGQLPERKVALSAWRTDSKMVLDRVELQRRSAQQKSFRVYTKEYDVLTGVKKQRMDPEKLAASEAVVIEEMERLLGRKGTRPPQMPRTLLLSNSITRSSPGLGDSGNLMNAESGFAATGIKAQRSIDVGSAGMA